MNPRPCGGPRRPPRAPRGLLLPARRERRDGVRREKAEAPDALEESPVRLELRLAGEGAREAPGPARDGAPPERARRDADVVERMAELPKRIGLPALGRLARRLERLAAGLPDGSAFLHRRVIIGREDKEHHFTRSSRFLHAVPPPGRDTGASMKTLAAIDIGTNSIKLLVANVEEDGTLDVVLREKEMVRLGSETLRTGVLSPEAIEAGASTVEHLAKLAHGSGAEVVRAVATCAVREATNSDAFVAAVKKRTGVRVDVISGEESIISLLVHRAKGVDAPRAEEVPHLPRVELIIRQTLRRRARRRGCPP